VQELEARCRVLEQNLRESEGERAHLTVRLRDLEHTAVRAARELERKERQVDELSIRGAELTQQLVEREGEIAAATERAAELERAVYRLHSQVQQQPDALDALSPGSSPIEGGQVLCSADDDEERLGDMPTLAALRQRLYMQYDASLEERSAGTGGPALCSTGSAGFGGFASPCSGGAGRPQQDAAVRIQHRRLSSAARCEQAPAEAVVRLYTPRRNTPAWGRNEPPM